MNIIIVVNGSLLFFYLPGIKTSTTENKIRTNLKYAVGVFLCFDL